MTPQPEDEFFVGYLPLPRKTRRHLFAVALLSVLLLTAAAYALARTTRGAGTGKFAFGKADGVVGLLTVEPEATLWTPEPSLPGGVRGTLLVRQGKFGLSSRAAKLDGQLVRVRGGSIERDGQRMIELAAEPELTEGAVPARPAERDLGEVTLTGEIVDSKCYLGRMRPGDRRTHRACAQLCILGGIPPLFVTRDARGIETPYLLSTRDGHSIAQALLSFVAEPVQLRGRLSQRGNLYVLHTAVEHVTRL